MPIALRTDCDAVLVRGAALRSKGGAQTRCLLALAVEVIERGPIAAFHGVARWRIIGLAQMLWDDISLSVS